MAIVSKFSHSSATVDLNDTETGFSLAGDGWLPAVATPVYKGDPEPVVETMHLLLTDTSQDNIAADMQALHQMQVWADAYINDPTVEDPVWLHAKQDNETGERRAVVHKIEVQYGASWYGDEATALDIPLTLSVTRGPYWESTTARDLPQATATGMVYAYDYSATGATVEAHDIVGDVGARVRLFDVNVAANRTDIWMGLRSANKHGTLANFVSTWEFEDGGLASDCTTAADTGSSGGGHVVISESGENWDDEWNDGIDISLSTVCATANYDDQTGTYLGLIRSYCTTGTWEIYTEYGNKANSTLSLNQWRRGRTIEIADTAWRIYETDVFKIPVTNRKSIIDDDASDDDILANFTLRLSARRTSEAGDLYLDCIVLLPLDEGYLHLNPGYEDAGDIYFGESPSGIKDCIFAGHPGTVSYDNFTLPTGDGRIYYLSACSASTHTITEASTLNGEDAGKYYERWLSLRGAE